MLRALMTPTLAQLHIGVGISIGPPAPVHEEIVVVKPYPNAIWIPGYYQWHPKHHTLCMGEGTLGSPPACPYGVGAGALGKTKQRMGFLPGTLGTRKTGTPVKNRLVGSRCL